MPKKISKVEDINKLRIATRVGKIGIWRWDMTENLVEYDNQGCSIFSLQEHELPLNYQDWFELIHPDDRQRIDHDLQEALQTKGMYEGEYRIVRRDGSNGFIREIGQVQLNENGQPIEMIGVTQDVSRQVELEMAVRQKLKMEAIGQIAGGIAHDFNNILAIVLGNLELIDLDTQDENVHKHLKPAMRAAHRGAALTHKLLTYSRKQALAPTEVDPLAILEELRQLLPATAGETIDIELGGEVGTWPCVADNNELQTVLFNLAINARDAMPEGGTLTIEAKNVQLESAELTKRLEVTPGDYVCFSVTDTGTGIDDKIIEHIFEPFFTTKEMDKGSGLGLSMSLGFAKQSGGGISLDTQLGEGTQVKLYIPRAYSAQVLDEPDAATSVDLKGCKVMVVEDDMEVSETVLGFLERFNCIVEQAESGDEAIEICRRKPDVDVFLLDFITPGELAGHDLANALKQLCPNAAVVFMTGYPDELLAQKAGKEERINLLRKPFLYTQLGDMLLKVTTVN